MRQIALQTQVSEEEGGGGAPGTRAESPLQTVEKTMVRQAMPLQPMESHGGGDIDPAASRRPHDGAGACDLKESAAPVEVMLEQALVRS